MSATSNYRVNLQFDADTSAARSKISELQSLLTKISAGTGTNSMATGLQEASAAAQELQIHLTNAFNVKTGKLDLSLLNKSLKSSGDSISNLTSKLLTAGKTGQDAFLGVAQAIASADQPMFQINQKLKDFSKTMQNTVKWQISSSILHGFMSSMSQAYNYAKDLNESLNDIRIVTGYNTDQMAKFATQANKAAKALSTTTTNYTNSSLVYYQQGLTDEEVAARTNVTIKMANAAGESAETVSQQLTAVWNNFYDGSKSLEYYADVMTALGAATASSTDEISEGLNKFAAAAETVGLSYEYATAALATVTATTRESADVVGTAFKTLFSRLQDLELGNTLDDGTSLGSYSQALAKVGINIKTTSGELKDMDQILDEMGSKWDSLSKAQQTALAQTTAGTRQYTQLVALMNNYDYFKENLEVARNSEGTLQKQADIYAESWEAAEKRVKASMQGLYQSLLDDKFFIGLNNAFATVLSGFNDFIDKAGGMKTVLIAIGGILMQMYAKEMPSMLSNLRNNLEVMTGHADKAYNRIMEDMKEASAQAKQKLGVKDDSSYGIQIDQANVLLGLKNKLALASDKMSESDKLAAQIQLDTIKAQQNEVVERKKKIEAMQEELELQKEILRESERADDIGEQNEQKAKATIDRRKTDYFNEKVGLENKVTELEQNRAFNPQTGLFNAEGSSEADIVKARNNLKNYEDISNYFDTFVEEYQKILTPIQTKMREATTKILNSFMEGNAEGVNINFGEEFVNNLTKINDKVTELTQNDGLTKDWIEEIQEELGLLDTLIPDVIKDTTGLGLAFEEANNALSDGDKDKILKTFANLQTKVKECKIESKEFATVLKGMGISSKNLDKYTKIFKAMGIDVDELKKKMAELDMQVGNFKPNQSLISLSTTVTSLGGAAMSAYSSMNSLGGIIEALSNPDTTGWEKFSAVFTGLAATIPQLISGFKSLQSVNSFFKTMADAGKVTINGDEKNLAAVSASYKVLTGSLGKLNIAKALEITQEEQLKEETKDTLKARIAERLQTELGISASKSSRAATILETASINGKTVALKGLTGGLKKAAIAANALVAIIAIIVVAFKAWQAYDNWRKQQNKEFAEKTEEVANKIKEENKANQELLSTYQEALETYKETGKNKQDLITKASSAAAAYKIEGAAALILAGNYDALTEAMEKANIEANKKEIQTTRAAISAHNTTFVDDLRNGRGYTNAAGGKYKINFGYDSSSTMAKAFDANKNGYKYLTLSNGALKASVDDWSDPRAMTAYYEEVEQLLSDLTAKAQETGESLSDNAIYKQLSKELADAKNSYDLLKSDIDNFDEKTMQNAIVEYSSKDGKGYKDLETLEEFNDFKDSILKTLTDSGMEADQALKILEAYLSTIDELKQFNLESQGFAELAGKVSEEELSKIQNYYNNLTDSEKTVFWSVINIDENTTLENVQAAMKGAQKAVEKEHLKTSLDLVTTLKTLIVKENKTDEDYNNIKIDYKKFVADHGNTGLEFKSTEDFMKMSQQEQEKYINMISRLASNQKFSNKGKDYLDDTLNSLEEKNELNQQYIDKVAAQNNLQDQKNTLDTYSINKNRYNEIVNNMDDYNSSVMAKQAIKDKINTIFGSGFNFDITDFQRNQEIEKWFEENNTDGQFNTAITTLVNLRNGYDVYESGVKHLLEGLNVYATNTRTGLEEVYQQAKKDVDEMPKGINYSNEVLTEEGVYQEYQQLIDEKEDNVVKNFDLKLDEVTQLSNALEDTNENLKDNKILATEVAKEMLRYNRAVSDLSSNYDDWKKVLSPTNTDLVKQTQVMATLKDTYADFLDLDDSNALSTSFLKDAKNLELMKEAAEGSQEAYDKLQAAAAKDIYAQNIGEISEETAKLFDQLSTELNTFSVGDIITGGLADQIEDKYYEIANAIIAGGKTIIEARDTANQWMATEGLEVPEIEYEAKTVYYDQTLPPNVIPELTEAVKGGIDGNGIIGQGIHWTLDNSETSYPMSTTILVPKGKFTLRKSSEKAGGGTYTPSGGGGSSKKAKTVKQSDVVDRYKEVTDKLDLNTKAMDRASKAADRLYGADRLKKMDEVNKRLQTEISLQQRKAKEAEAYLAQDKQSLLDAASAAGVSLAFDKDGTISNYTAVMNGLWNQLNNEITAANADGNADDTEQARIDAIQEKIDNLKEAISQYDDTRGVLQDIIDAQQEAINQIQDNNADILNTKLELRIEINENDLKKIEYELSKIEDNAFKAAEAMALTADQQGSYLDELIAYQTSYADLQEQYAKGNISQADYIEGLKTVSDGIYDQLTNLNELKKNMSEYYGDVIDKANEEIAKYTDRLDHLNDVLDHYVDLMDLLGKSKDYKALGELYAGQAKVLKDSLETAQSTYNMYADEAAEKKAQYERYLAEGNAAQAEYYKKQWQTAQNAADEAQSDLLEKTQAWAEAEKKVIENSLSALGRSLEETLTGGTSFDELTTAMDRAESLQEEYLTTTNKIYETNKLMRKAQQEIDKTTNSVAKRRLADFIAETDSLQNKNKLSEYELKIQQAKYDLLLAEIALEEAQNAKSTVRLQRDAEGNFGYVYTADADKISQAEQDLEDKQNDLYNIALEGANNYSKKYAETLQEMYDTLSELQTQYLEGEITSQEEYERKVAAAQEYYYQLLKDYSSLYQVAITTDNRVVADAWSTSFSEMIDQTDEWQAAVGNYLEQCAENLKTWQETVAEVMKNTGLDDVANKVSNITKESDELKKALLGDGENKGVIDALDKQFDSIAKLIEQWADYLPTLDGQIKKYEELAAAIRDIIKAENERVAQEAKYTDATGSGNGGTNNTSGTGTVDVSGVTGSGSGSGGGVYGSDVSTADDEDTKKIKFVQSYIGIEQDGIWGPASKKACLAKLQTDSWNVAYYRIKRLSNSGGGNTGGAIGGPGPKDNFYTHFASGGYTGEWGSYGKLAVLHEKELVLNKTDTSNLLASVDLLDHILQTLDLQTASTQFASRLTSAGFNSYAHDTLEQNVHIEANFPNVSDRNEIEEAFNNIINRASQYANRK